MTTAAQSAEAKEQAYREASLGFVKDALVKAVTEGKDAETIMSEALSVAKAEGAFEAAGHLAHAVEGGTTKEEAAEYLTSLVLNGPGDTWSGRGNDGRRARYEGMLSVLKKYKRGY
jgi:hypothetical protein